ncbi:LOW QUALITY PROTEIN: late embryogenesis abundant protein D-34-like [Tripterygium wilfordii]|uniref:LOW QUALITY PROTEIN: late embryogenesis abundant protein D-34-like n=1 Tax=Tripterygium wilfordii TaxID=458696 RepID=UPI0018F8243B|nr:LOW QUALITY PROTEIN: late embryogenesis abundant protein D-34-like [Tripterygium wilfordii]
MSQIQQRTPGQEQEPINYGDVFNVSGPLATRPIAPEDAAMMQTAETTILGKTKGGGPAAVMQSAATVNERAGLVDHHHRDVTDIAGTQGVAVTEFDVPGARIITESVGGQVVGQYTQVTPVSQEVVAEAAVEQSKITIGEALEAAAYSASKKPVDQSDAAAIQAAEVRATGSNVISPGGLAASAQSAASFNANVDRDEVKVKLGEVLRNATTQLPADKAATRQDAEGVASAELRNDPNLETHPGGVAASINTAARINDGMNV